MTLKEFADAVTRRRGKGDSFWVPGAAAVVELTSFPQNGPPPHIHHHEDEAFYFLDGTFSVLLDDREIEAGSVPVTSTPFRFLVILTPGGFENFWREIGQPATQDLHPPAPAEGIIEKLLAIAPKYHLEVVTP
jgi:hypothetical protein